MTVGLSLASSDDISFHDFDIKRALGSGGFGTCYEAIFQGMIVAVKKLNRTSKKKAVQESFQAETRPELFKFDHPHIVRLITASSFSLDKEIEDLFTVMEYIEGQSLQQVIDDQNQAIDLSRRVKLSYEITSALEYLHENGIAHLDLKPANVMLTLDGFCKLTDFGCCQYIEDDPASPTKSHLTGTFAFRAPELLKGLSPTGLADVFSLGITMWQLWSREFPYSGMNQHAVIFRVVASNLRPKIGTEKPIEENYKNLMVKCWAGKPQDRPSATEVLQLLKSMMEPS